MSKLVEYFNISTESIGDSLVPKKQRAKIQQLLRKADIYDVPYFTYGLVVYMIIILSFLVDIFTITRPVFIYLPIWFKIIISFLVIPIVYVVLLELVILIYKLYLEARIQYKVGKMEQHFPDFLTNFALNLRSGQSIDRALENSADKEFGKLRDEIMLIVRRIRLGGGVEEAIDEFRKKYDSDVMNDTFELVLISWKKGGNTANLVDMLYDNIKASRFLRDKIVASVTNYKIFLTVLALGIAPAMFALTYHLIDLVRRISSELVSIPDSVALPFTINAVRINDGGFITFSVLSVLLISVCISFIISIVKSGQGNQAYKQLLFYTVGSYAAYQLFMFVFKIFFSLFRV